MSQKRYSMEQIIPMLRRADVELGQGKSNRGTGIYRDDFMTLKALGKALGDSHPK